MKIRVHNLYIRSCHVKDNCTFVLLSDLHSDPENVSVSYKVIDTIEPDFICISGDIYDSAIDKKNIDTQRIIRYNGNKYPTFLVKGNHDELVKDPNYFRNLGCGTCLIDNTTEGIVLGNYNIKVYEMNFTLDYYLAKEPKAQFVDRLSDYSFDKDRLNIMLTHSPNGFINNDGSLINLNPNGEEVLILSGHNHDGLLPHAFHKIIPHNIGIVTPSYQLFQKNIRGNYEDHNTCLIIGGGITKLHKSPLGRLLISDMYVINLIPSKTPNERGNNLSIIKEDVFVYKIGEIFSKK